VLEVESSHKRRSGSNNKKNTSRTKRGRPTKEANNIKKNDKKDMIEIDKFNEEDDDVAKIKWKDFKVHHLIVIRGEMNKEFAKITNKQGQNFKTLVNLFTKVNVVNEVVCRL
jgi:hypothetical protein